MANLIPLPNTLGDVLSRCQGLLEDLDGDWVSLEYATPFINQAYEQLKELFQTASNKKLQDVREVLDVPLGTQSLYYAQSPGDPNANPAVPPGPLFGLRNPRRVWAKTAGVSPVYYAAARGPLDFLPMVQPPGVSSGGLSPGISWAYMGGQLRVTPVNGPTDQLVWGDFNPPRLTNLNDNLVIWDDATAIVAFVACSLIGVGRSNPAVLAGYAEAAAGMADNIVAQIILQVQGNQRRMGKLSGGQFGGLGHWFWG